jgi:hypothetical protein
MYKKDDIVDIKRMVLFKNECPTNVTMGKLEEESVLPSMPLALLRTSELRARFLPRELVCVLSTVSTLRAKTAS